jgi:hypothetical protein
MTGVDDPKNIRDFIADIGSGMKELENEYPTASTSRKSEIEQKLRDARDALCSNVRRLQ